MLTHTLVLSAGQLFAKALSIIWTFYLARRLGVEVFGRWAGILAFASIFSVLRDFSSLNLVIREVSQDRKRVPHFFCNAVLLYFCLCILALICLVVSGFLILYPPDKMLLLALAGLSFVTSAPALASQAALYGTERFSTYALLSAAGTIAYVGLGALWVEMGFSVPGALAALCLGNAFSSFLLYRAVVKEHGRPDWKVDPALWKSLLKFGGILTLGTLMSEIAVRSDRLIIEKFWGEASVGYYQAALALAYIPREVLLIPMAGAVYPRLVRDSLSEKGHFRQTLERMNFLALLLTLPGAFVSVSVATPLLLLVYGRSYAGADKALCILLAALPFVFLSGIWNQIFLVRKKEKQFVAAAFFLMTFTLALNLLLVPSQGFVGSSRAYLIAQAGYLALVAYLVRKDLVFVPAKRLAGLLVSSAAAGVVAYLLKHWGLWYCLAGAAGAYALSLKFLGVVAPEEWDWIKSRLRMRKAPKPV